VRSRFFDAQTEGAVHSDRREREGVMLKVISLVFDGASVEDAFAMFLAICVRKPKEQEIAAVTLSEIAQ
jgi:hypothetical protein